MFMSSLPDSSPAYPTWDSHTCHYVFAHRRKLDFQSVLDEHNTASLMTMLYAHSRVESIQNFCLNPLLDELSRYFKLYWTYQVVNIDQYSDWGHCVQTVKDSKLAVLAVLAHVQYCKQPYLDIGSS